MKQFGKIFKFELKYYLKNKIFVGITLFLVILIGLVMFFPRVMEALGNEQKLLTYERYAQQKELVKLEQAQVQKLQVLEMRLPRKISYEQIMNELYVLADENAIKLLSLKQLSKAKGKERGI